MKPNWTDRQLSHHLRRLSTTPPNTSFEQRLSLSLGLAADEIRASRMPPVPAPRTRKRQGFLVWVEELGKLLRLIFAKGSPRRARRFSRSGRSGRS
jgi:hypothetical protein